MNTINLKEMIKNSSIKWRIFCCLMVFCGGLLLTLWLFQTVFLESFYKHIKTKAVDNTATAIVRNIDNSQLQSLVERLSETNDVCIEVLDQDKHVLYSADVLRECLIHKMSDLEKQKLFIEAANRGGEHMGNYDRRHSFRNEAFNGEQFIGKVPSKPPGTQETLIYTKILITKQGEQRYLLINSVISPVDATVTTLRVQLYYITALMLGLAVVLALLLAKSVAKPIETINQSAKVLAKGNYEATFNGTGYKEVKELSDTLNYAANELSKVEHLRRELLANVSHDLRTPLTLISGYAEVMRDLPDENNADNAQIIYEEAQRLTRLVNDLLEASKLQSGSQTLQIRQFDLTQSLENIVRAMNQLVKQEGYSVSFDFNEHLIIQGDETQIGQAFYNLLTNGINYTGPDRLIRVRQIISQRCVTIEVIDSGQGIDEADLPYIWERYYRVDKNHKCAITGTGLGLSIVKAVISNHGGEYGVHSQLQQGSTFWFQLPIN